MEHKQAINYKFLIISILAVVVTAFIGGLFTAGNTSGDWYESVKPSLTPPSYVFPIVWNILFLLIALSLYFSLVNSNNKTRNKVFIAFGINFILNMFWSFLYFFIKRPDYALIEVVIFWFSILYLVIFTYKIDKKASYMLIPYLLWVAFASVLNYLTLF